MTDPSSSKVLPVKGRRNVLITSALPYVNNVPHLGNLIGCVLSADVFARYCRGRGYNTLFICGTDEYGTATETKALQEKCTPKEVCDKYHALHRDIYEWFNCSFDKFGRTTDPQQTPIAQDIFLSLQEQELLSEKETEQLFCCSCSKFLADRFVEGECPLCGYPDARGDQCDGCAKLLNATELKSPRCKVCGSSPVIKSSEHVFIELPKLQERLEKWISEASTKGEWSSNAIHVSESWLKKGLHPRCITRDLKWGTPVPWEKYNDKVFYVWFDAPIGYLSITAEYTDEWKQWWQNPENVQLYQFMGKDNIPFHTVMFPSTLLGTKQPWTMLHHLSTTEYLTYEGQKFSKSRNVGVFGNQAKETGIPSEIWRYCLLSNRPENADSDFGWNDLQMKTKGELLKNFGNFVNRAGKFIDSRFKGVVPALGTMNEVDQELIKGVNALLTQYIEDLEKVKIREGLKVCMSISQLGNKYLQDEQPWVLFKKDPERCATVLNVAINLATLVTVLMEPYTPNLSKKIFSQLNLEQVKIPTTFEFIVKDGHQLGKITPVIKEIPTARIEELKAQFGGVVEEKFEIDARLGEVVTVSDHPKADSLYVLQVNVGESEPRQVVAGLKSIYKPEELTSRKVLVVCNLKPANFRGVKSQGMLLAAEDKKTKVLGLLKVKDESVEIGTTVQAGSCILEPKPKLDYKKDLMKMKLFIGEHGEATIQFAGEPIPLTVDGNEVGTDKNLGAGARIR